MKDIKDKKYFSPPTCKQINAILSKGWKLTSINSKSCLGGEIISIKKEDSYLLSFDKCNVNEEYYCLQRFIYYTLWSVEEYTRAMEEIGEYKKQGACIISTILGNKVALTRFKEVIPPLLSSMEDKVDVLYYIILPKKWVNRQDEKKADDEMLIYLGFKTYPNVLFGMSLFVLLMIDVSLVLWAEVSFGFLFKSSAVILPFILFCFCIKDCYCFFRYRLYRKEYSVRYFLRKKKKEREMRLD